ncbi:MAG: cysteine synthase family protein [Chloroflexota bacterium]
MNILGQIGNTPLLKLTKVIESPEVDIFVKCEFLNPSGSIKDRMALSMIEEAEKNGELKPGGTIIEQSTGNTGPALAFVGAVKGYKVQLFIPTQLSGHFDPTDRIRIARLFGCEVIPIDMQDQIGNLDELNNAEKAAAFIAIRMKQCYDLCKSDPLIWWPNQLCNVDNAKEHREQTGKEILEQMDGKVDAWVASIGTGGTIQGVAEALRESNPDLVVSGVVPADDPRFEWIRSGVVHRFLESYGLPKMRFLIEDILEKNILNHEIMVRSEDARNMANRLCSEEGLFCGISSGANVYAAVEMAKKMKKGSRIVTVLVDRRDRYFAEYPNGHYVV